MNQIVALQVLRAIAALAVALGHLQHESLDIAGRSGQSFRPVLMEVSGAGVDLFFVISGFVMVYSSRSLFAARDGFRIFLGRRLARIVPLYWVMTSLFLAAMFALPKALSSDAPTLAEIAKSYLFLPYAHDAAAPMQPAYKLGWTLNYEMFFYVCFAVALALPIRRAVYIVTLTFASLVAAGLVAHWPRGPLSFWSDPIILEFVAGMWIAMLRLDERRLSAGAALALAGCGLALFGAAIPFVTDEPLGALRPVLFGLPAIALVAAGCMGPARFEGRFWRALALAGDASYALYLVHPMVIRALRLVWDKAGLAAHVAPWLFVAAGIIIILPLAIVVYQWFERPMTRLCQSLFGVTTRRRLSPEASGARVPPRGGLATGS